MKPTDNQIEEYQASRLKQLILELDLGRFQDALNNLYDTPVALAAIQAIKDKDTLLLGEIVLAQVKKDISYLVERDVERYINDFADDQAAVRADELRLQRKDAA